MKPMVQALALGTAWCLAMCAAAAPGPVVRAPAGVARGVVMGDVLVFKGLPYALGPVGERRWRAPEPMPPWAGERTAAQFGPPCYQPKSRPTSIYAEELPPMSEDCLTLNVFTPPHPHKAPVLVWIHGGALTTGWSGDGLYDGTAMAKRGVIVSNVTIAGESAGALSVMYLLASPPARGLFARAIAQSAYMISTPELRTPRFGEATAETIGSTLADKLGAHDLAALRAMDADALTDAAAHAGYAPFGTIDGHFLPRQLVEVFDRGEQAKVPLLAGFNSGEIRSLRFLAPPPPASAAEYTRQIRDRYADLAEAYLAVYPPSDLAESVLRAPRDALYGWTAERLVSKQTALGASAFLYFFDHGYPAADGAGLHAFHASEIPYVFGTADRVPPAWPKVPADFRESRLSEAMTAYWVAFARDGFPDARGQPQWLPYGADRAYLAFRDAPREGTHLLPGMYELHERVVCRRHADGGIPWNWNVGILSPPLPPEVPACK
jgi:para-nitrobenzyl esterase